MFVSFLLKPVLISLLTFALTDSQSRQVNDRQLPEELTETETQTIIKEQRPKQHVEATIKVSDARINNALKSVQESRHEHAAEEVDIYASLIKYADDYTRKLPRSQIKDRNHCLKKIEQAIFKTSRTFDAIMRELPFNYRESAQQTVEDLKKIRLRAINDLLGGGNIINSSNE
ncbi:MAG: hypothetical protein L0220_00630 [Acidobacteria bacterium]|nr:hypothetical protein [Acidobacteriota bacterium]